MVSSAGKEAKILWKKLSIPLVEKWEKPCSEVRGFVKVPA
jgi:hypothetical protein